MSKVLRFLVKAAALLTVSIFIIMVGYIVVRGIPGLSWDMFAWKYTSENQSLVPAMITTLMLIILVLLIAIPFGVLTGIYLTEYARQQSKVVIAIRLATETLAGIPSIVYGLFGMLFFVFRLQWSYSLIAGAFTAAIMVLPLIIRTTEEALLSVDPLLKQASLGLGATKLQTIIKVALPVAMPGILAGIMLSIGRIVGETAAFIFTLGTMSQLPTRLTQSGRTLALHMYMLSSEAFHVKEAFATALVLLIIVLIINRILTRLSKWVNKTK